MEVLIVSKTHMAENFACVGGLILATNQAIRLLEPNGYNQPANTSYDVGDIWDLNFNRRSNLTAPHIEDVLVQSSTYRRGVTDLASLIRTRNLINWDGHIDGVFDGHLEWTSSGSGYIPSNGPLSNKSVGFWVSNRDLSMNTFGDKIRYRFPNSTNYRGMSYVGFQTPIDILPAGTILRLSLSRLFPKPGSDIIAPSGFYLQLSGWYED